MPALWHLDSLDPARPPVFESQAHFLRRHKLLIKGEKPTAADFEPERLLIEVDEVANLGRLIRSGRRWICRCLPRKVCRFWLCGLQKEVLPRQLPKASGAGIIPDFGMLSGQRARSIALVNAPACTADAQKSPGRSASLSRNSEILGRMAT